MNRARQREPLGGLVAIVVLGLSAVQGCAPATESSAAPAPAPTMASSAARSDEIRATCQLVSQRSVKLKSQLPGEIEQVMVQLGERVRAGQVLARLKQADLRLEEERLVAQRQQADARIAVLELQLLRAQRDRQAVQELYAPGQVAVSKEALVLREREAELRQAQITRQVLDIDLRAMERRLSQTAITAPMGGVVLARNAEAGMVTGSGLSSVTGSDVLFELGDPEQLRAECAARPRDALRLRPGLPVRLQLDGLSSGREIALQISRVAPAVSSAGGAMFLNFWGDFTRPEGLALLPGMQGHASVTMPP